MTAWYVSMKQSVRSITARQRYLHRSCLNKKIGTPDLVVLFTNTVSHKMVRCAVSEAKNKNIEVVRSHSSSQAALTEILEQRCEIA